MHVYDLQNTTRIVNADIGNLANLWIGGGVVGVVILRIIAALTDFSVMQISLFLHFHNAIYDENSLHGSSDAALYIKTNTPTLT